MSWFGSLYTRAEVKKIADIGKRYGIASMDDRLTIEVHKNKKKILREMQQYPDIFEREIWMFEMDIDFQENIMKEIGIWEENSADSY